LADALNGGIAGDSPKLFEEVHRLI
jgi:hypothetical protein